MGSFRHLTALHRRLMLALLACVLIARVAVPGGWMPMATSDGALVLAPCSGMGAMAIAAHPRPDTAMPHHATAEHADQHGGHEQPVDHPCIGAGVSLALDTVGIVPPVFAIRHYAPAVPRPLAVGIGRGLAAPPPPATGPPAIV